MLYELTKGEKKVARAAIDKGLEASFIEGMENFEAIIKKWRDGKFASQKEAYHALYKAIDKKDNAIGNRYNSVTGGRYLMTVVGILRDGHITEEDIDGFSDETKKVVRRWMEVL